MLTKFGLDDTALPAAITGRLEEGVEILPIGGDDGGVGVSFSDEDTSVGVMAGFSVAGGMGTLGIYVEIEAGLPLGSSKEVLA